MHRQIFGVKDDDDLEAIFNLDQIDPRHVQNTTNNRERWNCEVPQSNFLPNQANTQFCSNIYSDSAVGTESSMLSPPRQSNVMTKETSEFDDSSFRRPFMTQESFSRHLPIEEEMFSQDFMSSQVHLASNAVDHVFRPPDNVDHSINSSFVTEPPRTNETSLSRLSFFSLLRRNLLQDNVQDPSNFYTPMMTQERDLNTQGNREFSAYFEDPNLDGQNECNNPNSNIFSQGICTLRSNADLHRRVEDNQHSVPYQLARDPVDTQPERRYFDGLLRDIPNAESLPDSILDLYWNIKSTDSSDWAFVYALSAQTCQEFIAMNNNVILKLSLLLSIASINSAKESAPIPIMAFGKDSSLANSIMSYMGNFAPRFLAPTDHIFNVEINSNKRVEIGPVFLAKNGVCFLGDWSGLPKKMSDETKILLDTGRFFFNQTSETFRLGSALWAYWSPTERNRKDFVNVAMFMKYFGIPIEMDSKESDNSMEYILRESKYEKMNIPDDGLCFSLEDMKSYLNVVRKIDVKKSEEANKLLTLYYDAIEKDRQGLLSVKSFQIIQQMAESFAKLSLRNEVIGCDVVNSIAIAEKTFFAITGLSRAPLLPAVEHIDTVDQYIQEFHKWVFNYVGFSPSN